MKAISLHQPWASLLVTRQPLNVAERKGGQSWPPPMIKRFESRSWPFPPALIGQPVAFHATQRKPDVGHLGDWLIDRNRRDGAWMRRSTLDASVRLPLGAVVGSGRITACYPIVGSPLFDIDHVLSAGRRLYLDRYLNGTSGSKTTVEITADLPYGDFTPGRYAWQIEDAAPTRERCPWCRGSGDTSPRPVAQYDALGDPWPVCRVCGADSEGGCDPIPVRGRQRIWLWQAS